MNFHRITEIANECRAIAEEAEQDEFKGGVAWPLVGHVLIKTFSRSSVALKGMTFLGGSAAS